VQFSYRKIVAGKEYKRYFSQGGGERSIGRLKEVKDEGVTWDNIIEPRE
jgi:hypothetical protein